MKLFTKEKTIAFTGNRILTSSINIPRRELNRAIYERLLSILEREYLENGIDTFISGMALGFDMICASVVLELRGKYPDIRLIAALPFIEQDAKYPTAERQYYRQLVDRANISIVIGGYSFSNQAYHLRNDFMLENSSKMIAYHSGSHRSGTGSTIRKASELGIEVVNIYF